MFIPKFRKGSKKLIYFSLLLEMLSFKLILYHCYMAPDR